jgi:leucyl aminopeptidase
VTTFSYSSEPPADIGVGALVLPVFEGPEPGPGVSATGLQRAYAAAKLTGKKGQNLLVVRRGGDGFAAGAVLLVGAGAKADFSVARMRRVLARAAPSVRRFGKVATTFPQAVGARHAAEAVAAGVEAFALGTYRFDRYLSKPDDDDKLASVVVLGAAKWDAKMMRSSVKQAAIVAEAVCWARDLVNTPAGDLPPAKIADAARQMAKKTGGLACKTWTEKDLEKGGFGGILGVGRGSVNPPTLIELRYSGAGNRTPIALTGKGISFDSGGLSIKDAKSMERMKDDMGGAAAVLATMQVIARVKPKINVIAAIPCSENLPSGSAQKPGDVIHHYGGITSEVLNTDAEGRLILADSLAYLAKQKPELIIDAATLTGGCVVALGPEVTGAFGNDDALVRELKNAAEAVGEPMWQLPLYRDYRPMIDSAVADVKNSGDRSGSAITAALFLAEFVGDIPWVHLDIAGPAFSERDTDLGPRGATGVPVRTLVRFLLDRAAKPPAKTARSSGSPGR